MSIKDLPHVTVEQVLALRKAAIELEREIAELKTSLPKVRADAVNGYHSELIAATKFIFHPHFEGVKAVYFGKLEQDNE